MPLNIQEERKHVLGGRGCWTVESVQMTLSAPGFSSVMVEYSASSRV